MKKILGIIAAGALIATSVFAADISAKVQLEGSLFNYDGTNMSALTIDKPAGQNWNPVLSTSINGDNAGAEFVIYSGEDGDAFSGWNVGKKIQAKGWKIWFAPFDGLKLNLGAYSFKVNEEQIDWSGTTLKAENDGYAVSYTAGGFTAGVAFIPGLGNKWFNKEEKAAVAEKTEYQLVIDQETGTYTVKPVVVQKAADAESILTIGNTAFTASYGADWGTINALFFAENTFKKNTIAAGYNGNFGPVFAFLNAGVVLEEGKDAAIREELFAKGNAGDFGWALFQTFDYQAEAKVGAKAKLTYPLGGNTAYLYLKDDNFLAKDFAMEIKPGMTGNVGGAGWEVAVDMNIGKTFTVNVPVTFSYGW